MSNNDAITLARACVERGDIAQAIRYLNLLKGESAKVSKVIGIKKLQFFSLTVKDHHIYNQLYDIVFLK